MTVVELIEEMLNEVDKSLEKCLENGNIRGAGLVSAVGSGLGALQMGLIEGDKDVALEILKAFLGMASVEVKEDSKLVGDDELLSFLGACMAFDEEED